MAQEAFLAAPEKEVGVAGNRGSGKTDILVLDAFSNVGRGYGSRCRMSIVRPTQREMTDVITRAYALAKKVWPGVQHNKNKNFLEWPSGEVLEFNYMSDAADAFDLFQGKEYLWIGCEELQLWPSLRNYLLLFSVLRSSLPPSVPRKMRFTCNPNGPSHNALRWRFGLSGVPTSICGPRIVEATEDGIESDRRMVFCNFDSNVLLRRTEPGYMKSIEDACAGDNAKLQAWKYGNWDITSGGAFDSIFFEHEKNIYEEEFDVPPSGRCLVSYDDGQSKPWALLYIWENSSGDDIQYRDGRVRSGVPGDLHLIGEQYGWNGRSDEGLNQSIPEIVGRCRAYEIKQGWRWRDPVTGKWKGLFRRGVADSAIFDPARGPTAPTVNDEFRNAVRIAGEVHSGYDFAAADKSPGSRTRGYTMMRERLIACSVEKGMRRRERPGLFVVKAQCPQFARTIPVLPRSKKNADDVDSAAEDHIFDACRYALTFDRTPIMTYRGTWRM